MACFISFREESLRLNNRSFNNAITFAIETGRGESLSAAENAMLERVAKAVDDGEYWPGRDIELETDFPELEERKFWARLFFDTARAIFDEQVGSKTNKSWRTRMIYVTYSIAHLFVSAVHEHESGWWPNTKDKREEDAFLASLDNRPD